MKVYTFDNKVLTHDSKWLKEAAVPQEIIIPVSSTDDYTLYYDINDVPLNTPLTFSYTNYRGDPSNPPTYISVIMRSDDWAEYEMINSNLTDKATTFTITNKGSYTVWSINVNKGNDSTILISDISGYKLSYMG